MGLNIKFLISFLFFGEVICLNFTVPSSILINSSTTKTSTEVPKTSTDLPKSSTRNLNVTLPPTSTTTVKNKPVMRNFKSKNDADEEKLIFCTCNLKHNYCDINCCCDKDCTANDKSLFKFCEVEKNIYFDSRYCDYVKHIYINNTQYEWEVNQNGLFCIVKSNLPASYLVQKKNPLKDANEAKFLATGRYSWMNDILATENGTKEFAYGKPIWILNSDNTLKKIEIPTNIVSPACIIKQEVQFLSNFYSKCIQLDLNEKNLDLDASTYVQNVLIISSPQLFNGSMYKNPFQDCPKNICILISIKICNFEFGSCKKLNGALPVLKCESNSINNVINNIQTCQNVVKSIKYKIYHEGGNGIKKVELLIAMGKLFFENSFKLIQEFSVEFFWLDETGNYSDVRSGNPGYNVGKPILIAQQSKSEIIRRSPKFAENFLVLPGNIDGYCILEDDVYIEVEFGYNLLTKCMLQVAVKGRNFTAAAKLEPNIYCRKIKENMLNYWLSQNRTVGMFGNANVENHNDWTPILLDDKWENLVNKTNGTNRDKLFTCTNLFSQVVINIYYARVDINNLLNQPKILGVYYKFTDLKNYTFNYEKTNILETKVTSEVTFFDVTAGKKKKFVDPPSFRISLPYDFFYPFVKLQNNSPKLEFKFCLVFSAILSFIVF